MESMQSDTIGYYYNLSPQIFSLASRKLDFKGQAYHRDLWHHEAWKPILVQQLQWELETLSGLYSEVRGTWCPTGKLFACSYTVEGIIRIYGKM